jgi:hypothetical protein
MTPGNVTMYSAQHEQDLLLELPYCNLYFQTIRRSNVTSNSKTMKPAGTSYYKFCLYKHLQPFYNSILHHATTGHCGSGIDSASNRIEYQEFSLWGGG